VISQVIIKINEGTNQRTKKNKQVKEWNK